MGVGVEGIRDFGGADANYGRAFAVGVASGAAGYAGTAASGSLPDPGPAFLRGVDQFGSGVLVGVSAECRDPHFRQGGLWTEDDEFADLEDPVVEIRMFDTSYISVASTDESLRTQLMGARWCSGDVPSAVEILM
jgi:hypothetical protein